MYSTIMLALITGLVVGSFNSWSRFGFDWSKISRKNPLIYLAIVAIFAFFSSFIVMLLLPQLKPDPKFTLNHPILYTAGLGVFFALSFFPSAYFFRWLAIRKKEGFYCGVKVKRGDFWGSIICWKEGHLPIEVGRAIVTIHREEAERIRYQCDLCHAVFEMYL